jgi:hypothetical protein
LFLTDALPGRERAVGDRLDQLLIGPIDQRRLGSRGCIHSPVLNSEFDSTGPIGASKGLSQCTRTYRQPRDDRVTIAKRPARSLLSRPLWCVVSIDSISRSRMTISGASRLF